MRIEYRICENKEIEIVRCYGADGQIVLPEHVEGNPVVRVAPYTFSARKSAEEEDVLSYDVKGQVLFEEDTHLLAGENVESVVFPNTVTEIGNYIFYGCRNLQYLEFSDTLDQIGSGAFTGCSGLGKLKVHQMKGKQSCVKEILGELWQRIDVSFLYGNETAKVVFPEHYEEAVENTPARILFTQHHGSGNRYRQCFYRKELDYRKYDDLFQVAAVYDKAEVVADLVFGRLLYPVELGVKYQESYEQYLTDHIEEMSKYLIREEKMDAIYYISRHELWTREGLEEAIIYAGIERKTEILSLLMEEKNRIFPQKPKQKKKYEL